MADNPLGVPPGIYSVTEACKWLRISRQSLTTLLIDHPHYAKNGNRKLFSQAHILQLWEAMQEPASTRTMVMIERDPFGGIEVPDRSQARLRELTRRKPKPRR